MKFIKNYTVIITLVCFLSSQAYAVRLMPLFQNTVLSIVTVTLASTTVAPPVYALGGGFRSILKHHRDAVFPNGQIYSPVPIDDPIDPIVYPFPRLPSPRYDFPYSPISYFDFPRGYRGDTYGDGYRGYYDSGRSYYFHDDDEDGNDFEESLKEKGFRILGEENVNILKQYFPTFYDNSITKIDDSDTNISIDNSYDFFGDIDNTNVIIYIDDRDKIVVIDKYPHCPHKHCSKDPPGDRVTQKVDENFGAYGFFLFGGVLFFTNKNKLKKITSKDIEAMDQ